jgi:hypothetical protein
MNIMPTHLLDDFVDVDIRFIIFTEIYTKVRNNITHRIKSRIDGEMYTITVFIQTETVEALSGRLHHNLKLNKSSILASLQK